MKITSINTESFKGYVPVVYYAKNPDDNRWYPVKRKENIRKCQSKVVRNLNGSLKKNKNEDFVDYYKSYDKDYKRNPVVRSVYSRLTPTVYMVSGKDVDVIDDFGKGVGIAKRESMEAFGHSQSFEARHTADMFFYNVKNYLLNRAHRLKSDNGKDLTLQVFFQPKYTKEHKVKDFEYVNARFVEETTESR